MSDSNTNKGHKKHCKRNHNFKSSIDMVELDFYDNPFFKGCTEKCLKEYIDFLDGLCNELQVISKIFQSIKISKDGTLPFFHFEDVISYYCGDKAYENEKIQELFKVNLLDFDLSDLKKRIDIPKDAEEKINKELEEKEESSDDDSYQN